MSRNRRVLWAAPLTGIVMLGGPSPVAAHAIGGTYTLPVPTWLYLVGAAVAVAASFVITTALARSTPNGHGYATVGVPDTLAVPARTVLRVLGIAWWYGTILAGLLVNEISPLPAVLLWIGIWVGLPIVAMLVGNPWPSLSPFRTTYAAVEAVTRLAGRRPDLGLTYPAQLARWPAVLLLALALWAELVLPGGETPGTVAGLMAGYTLLTLAGMVAFGPVAWLRNAELLEVELGWFGRIGPIGRRSRTPALCAECEERCDPGRCFDCPECAVAADDADRRAELRPWLVGLRDIGRPGWSDAAFIVALLAGVTYDGLGETAAGTAAFGVVYPVVSAVFGATSMTTFLLVEAIQLMAVFAAFLVAFVGVVATMRFVGYRGAGSLGSAVGMYATTLLPIAAAYLLAHYFTLAIQGAVWLPSLLADPLVTVAPAIDAIPVGAIWYGSVAAIVGGHVAAVVLSHRLALRDAGRRAAAVAGLPLVLLMIGYTVLSLWIIASPIVVDPATPAAIGG